MCHIAGEFARFLKNQLEEEDMYEGSKSAKRAKTEDRNDDTDQRRITDKEVLCLQIAGLCHDLGLLYCSIMTIMMDVYTYQWICSNATHF